MGPHRETQLHCAGNYEAVEPALASLEALGPALESHLQLLLPALVRLICPGTRLGCCCSDADMGTADQQPARGGGSADRLLRWEHSVKRRVQCCADAILPSNAVHSHH